MGADEKDIFGLEPDEQAVPVPLWLSLILVPVVFVGSAGLGGLWCGLALKMCLAVAGV